MHDANGKALTSVYFEDEPRRRTAVGLLTRDEAGRIATGVAKLAVLLTRPHYESRSREIEPGA